MIQIKLTDEEGGIGTLTLSRINAEEDDEFKGFLRIQPTQGPDIVVNPEDILRALKYISILDSADAGELRNDAIAYYLP